MDRTEWRPRYDAVLLAGGRASRLGGIDKTALPAGGRALFDRALDATTGAERVVVVGLREGHDLPPRVLVAREDPPFAGPAAAVAAGLAAVSSGAPWTLVLACDLVRPDDAVPALLAAAGARAAVGDDPDGFVAVDEGGHRQPLLALYRTGPLHAAVDVSASGPGFTGLSVRRLLAPLDLVELPVPSSLCADVDTPEDAERLT